MPPSGSVAHTGPAAAHGPRERTRLRTRAQLDRVWRDGRREAGTFCLAIALTPAPDGLGRVAYVVSRRYSPKAVVRNRARRLLREAYRCLRPSLTAGWVVLVPRQRMRQARAQNVCEDLRALCRRLGLLG